MIFIFSNKQCEPQFDSKSWYRPSRKEEAEFNSCMYQPTGWSKACRFVAMRIPRKPEETKSRTQQELFEEDRYAYRIVFTNLHEKAHEAIDRYDKRTDAEDLIGEVKQEGLAAIPSGKFKNNHAFFQIVMLAYNLWRYFKLLAGCCGKKVKTFAGVADNKIRIGRLILLMIGAKLVKSGNRDMVKYSIHDTRTSPLLMLFDFLDHLRFEKQQECMS